MTRALLFLLISAVSAYATKTATSDRGTTPLLPNAAPREARCDVDSSQSRLNELFIQEKALRENGGDATVLQAEIRRLLRERDPASDPLDDGADNCPVVVITSVPFQDTGTTVGKTNNHTPTCTASSAPDVVYDYMPSVSGDVTVSLCGSGFDTALEILQGPCPGFTWVACNDDFAACGLQSQLTVFMTAGEHYTIWVDGYQTSAGDYTITIDGPQLQGETCDNPLPLTIPGSVYGNSCNYADNYEYQCPWGSAADDVVYSFYAAQNMTVSFSLCHSLYDTKLFISENDCASSPIACSDDAADCPCAAGPYRSYIECLSLFAGNTYYVFVDGYNTECGQYQLDAFPCPACDVIQQPSDILESAEDCSDPNHLYNDPNGGCNSSPRQFGSVQNGQTVAGKMFTYEGLYGQARDTDWFLFTLNELDTVAMTCLGAECPLTIGIVDTSQCTSFLFSFDYTECSGTGRLLTTCLDPGTYALVVTLPFYASAVPAPLDYRLQIAWGPCFPANDNCDEATLLTLNSPTAFCSNNVGATTDCLGGYPPHDPEVWFTFWIPECMHVGIEFCGSDNPYIDNLELYSANCCGTWTYLQNWNLSNCEDDSPTWYYFLNPGQYWFPVRLNPPGNYCVRVVGTSGPPANDQCSNAQYHSGVGGFVFGSTLCATLDPAPACDMPITAPGVWYRLPGSGNTIRATTCYPGTRYDTRVTVYSCDCSGLTCVASNDDYGCPSFPTASEVSWCSVDGEEYLILVHGFGASSGSYVLGFLDEPEAPCEHPACCADYVLYADPDIGTGLNGVTTGAGNDCGYQPGEDVVVRVAIPEPGWWKFSLCNSDSPVSLYVSTSCCGTEYTLGGEWCLSPETPAEVCVFLQSGDIYAIVEGATGGNGDYVLSINLSAPPAGPINLTASDDLCTGVQLTWSDTQNEYQFNIRRDGISIGFTDADVLSFFDANPAVGAHLYTVEAVNSCGGGLSNSEWGTRRTSPAAVTDLVTLLWNADGDPVANDIRLTWTADSAAIGSYSVHASPSFASFPGPSWNIVASGLPPVIGPAAMHYVHDDAILSGEHRFYVVVSTCP